MTYAEMKDGFAQGRRLLQEEWATPDEIAAVDRLAEEGWCDVTPWEYRDNFQCEVRVASGRGTLL